MVKKWIGDTVHVRELNVGDYPNQEMADLLKQINYNGWVLLEGRTEPSDLIMALKEQVSLFSKMTGESI
jgi:hypothetical protein